MPTHSHWSCTPRSETPFVLCLAVGLALGAATGQMAVWIAVGAGLGAALGTGRKA